MGGLAKQNDFSYGFMFFCFQPSLDHGWQSKWALFLSFDDISVHSFGIVVCIYAERMAARDYYPYHRRYRFCFCCGKGIPLAKCLSTSPTVERRNCKYNYGY